LWSWPQNRLRRLDPVRVARFIGIAETAHHPAERRHDEIGGEAVGEPAMGAACLHRVVRGDDHEVVAVEDEEGLEGGEVGFGGLDAGAGCAQPRVDPRGRVEGDEDDRRAARPVLPIRREDTRLRSHAAILRQEIRLAIGPAVDEELLIADRLGVVLLREEAPVVVAGDHELARLARRELMAEDLLSPGTILVGHAFVVDVVAEEDDARALGVPCPAAEGGEGRVVFEVVPGVADQDDAVAQLELRRRCSRSGGDPGRRIPAVVGTSQPMGAARHDEQAEQDERDVEARPPGPSREDHAGSVAFAPSSRPAMNAKVRAGPIVPPPPP
jgi:hypothetical protein